VGLKSAELGQIGAERRQPPIGLAGRLRGLVDPVVLDRVGDDAVVEVRIKSRPVGGGAEAIANLGQRLPGRVGIVGDRPTSSRSSSRWPRPSRSRKHRGPGPYPQ
jgi:hypothetical protein